jgi:outer membrane protein TolC
MKIPALFALGAALGAMVCAAETRTLTLKQALQLALQQNPDLIITRLDEEKAREQVNINKSPFSPSVYAGSGAAWTYGFPTSIDGSAPSIFQARTSMSIYDKPQSYLVEEAKELQRGAGFGVEQRQAEVIFRVASAYIDAENDARALDAARQEDAELLRVKQLTQARVDSGQELTHASQKANVAELEAAHRVTTLGSELAKAERSLALVLGLAPGDRVHAADDQLPGFEPPVSQEQAVANALNTSPELKKLQSDLQAKALELKSYKAYKQPKVDLVAQYALLAPFNNYKEYFQRFQYNNIELGASFSIPLLVPRSAKAYMTSSEIDEGKIRTQVAQTRARIQNNIEDAFDDFRVADEGRTLALEDLNLTRESTTLDLSRLSEGQVLPAQVEQDRAEEQQKWRAYYDALAAAQHARLNLLRTTGTLQEALK